MGEILTLNLYQIPLICLGVSGWRIFLTFRTMTSEYFHSSSGLYPEDKRSSLRRIVNLDGQVSSKLKQSSTVSMDKESLNES